MTPRGSLEDVRRFIGLLWRPGDVFELRGLVKVNGQQHVTFGYFDDADAFAAAAVARSGADAGVYFTINPANPALLARAPKNKVRRAGNGDTTSDKDVIGRRRLVIDVDAVRPAGISATDAEHDAAIALVRKIREDLAAAGWPAPILGDSGNGGHLIYGIDLPVADEGLVKRVLDRLQALHGCTVDGVVLKVDTTMFNPARISKVFGTLARKGEDTPERPHRLARVIDAPAQLDVVSREQLESFAPIATRTPAASSGPKLGATAPRATFDLVAWLETHLPDAVEREWSSGRKWLLPVCPFNPEHDRMEAFVVQFPSGAVEAKCQHESCFKSWEALRVRFEPDAYQRNGHGTSNGGAVRMTDREPPPDFEREVLYEDPRFAADVARVEDAELERFADRDREVAAPRSPATQDRNGDPDPKPVAAPVWKRGRELVKAITDRMADPWISIKLVDDEILRVRVGGTVVLIGGSKSGKTSLACCLTMEHVVHTGPVIVGSIELPDEEFAARIVGQKCDASWEDSLRGLVALTDMERVLDHPRLFVLSRDAVSIKNLEAAIEAAKAEYPGQPILVVVDYAQILEVQSTEREIRQRVTEIFRQLDRLARKHLVVVLALSQMSRMSSDKARRGEALGADSAQLAAESAAIERYASGTLSIGLQARREDGSMAVELSIGLVRMGLGDRVLPMTYWGRSGKWLVAGDAKSATDVREQRDVAKVERERTSLENQLIGAAQRADKPLTRDLLVELVRGGKKKVLAAIAVLLARGELVEVAVRATRSKSFLVWTEDRARAAGAPLVRDTLFSEAS